MKKWLSVVMLLAVTVCLAGCQATVYDPRPATIVRYNVPAIEVRPAPVVVVPAPPKPYEAYYDGPNGWYVEGYRHPSGIWVAPFWTMDPGTLRVHFEYYRGAHKEHMFNYFMAPHRPIPPSPPRPDDRGPAMAHRPDSPVPHPPSPPRR